MEKVSVIVPVYNGEKSIKRCSDSILNQDYPELELILVDDGSRDCSWEINPSGERGRILRAQPGPCRGERNVCAVCGCG